MKSNVLVVPAGTEIGHEIFESLRYSKHFNVIGANSIRDHSEILYRENLCLVPFATDPSFVDAVQQIVDDLNIKYVMPAHDDVVHVLAGRLRNVVWVGPDAEIAPILRSKKQTIGFLENTVSVPKLFDPMSVEESDYPIFCKPDRGQGSRGISILHNASDMIKIIERCEDYVFQEYLPGAEVTVDCFSDPESKVLFVGPRTRARTSFGISARSVGLNDISWTEIAQLISDKMKIKGAWFYQMKEDRDGQFRLLEVANRIAGSSGYQRLRGCNLSEAWLHQLTGRAIEFCLPQEFSFVYDRAVYTKTILRKNVSKIYVDFDDTVVLSDGSLNYRLVGVLFSLRFNKGYETILITRHGGVVEDRLSFFGLLDLFCDIIHIKDGKPKSHYIKESEALLIDDSYRERADVIKNSKVIAVGPEALDLIEGLA